MTTLQSQGRKQPLSLALTHIRPILIAIVFSFSNYARADLVFTDALGNSTGYSTAQNPNGVWSYGEVASGDIGTGFTAYSTNSNLTPDLQMWSNGVSSAFSLFNTSAAPIGIADSTLAPGEVNLHANSGLASVARFTAQDDGIYSIATTFVNRTANLGTRVDVLHNGVSLFSDTTGNGFGSGLNFNNGALALFANDTLDFVVNTRLDGSSNSTTTQISGSISSLTAVPEPSTFAIGSIAVCAIATIRRRKLAKTRGLRV